MRSRGQNGGNGSAQALHSNGPVWCKCAALTATTRCLKQICRRQRISCVISMPPRPRFNPCMIFCQSLYRLLKQPQLSISTQACTPCVNIEAGVDPCPSEDFCG